MTEELLRNFLKEAKENGQIGLFIWENWSLWDDLSGTLKQGNETYEQCIEELEKGEDIDINLEENKKTIIIAVPTKKAFNSKQSLKKILKRCEKSKLEGPITFIPSNLLSKYY